ncbi:tRNA (N6-threonylcarbamoyladenosine(37)-N6)-methyltransferase TrmO [Blastochloris tepida]|uniref:tRNA (N6-threonylcarbamoyladenosine(37)-N6)-methyltransferase TrmO n=1 Tax=Blastochloris tepida TaxID=2233851 RepID=A0A348FW86_9HYPH|nr:tRNA (N6-threonylcarbamoyladenosine(37)-N6)-methyltransferase TrmO [Blastochloris tepida]BBF91569.1 tRNA (N6-threonylcarbamoyladenosine(37)-N6)-methyltransferase TrmO [Blastochloris tepida]
MTAIFDSTLRDGEIGIELPESFDAGLYFIGTIRTPFLRREDCPRSGADSDALCTIEVFERFADALLGIEAHAEFDVLYWLHRSLRTVMVQRPHHRPDPRGAFALRSPVRPNPIGLSACPLVKVEGRFLTVRGLDCLDGTPLIDLKPHQADAGRRAGP